MTVRDLDANQHTEEVLGGLLGWWSHSGVLLLATNQTQVIKGKNEFSFYAVVPCGVNKESKLGVVAHMKMANPTQQLTYTASNQR